MLAGEDAGLEEFGGQGQQGQKLAGRCYYAKKRDILAIVFGLGEEKAYAEYVKAIGIVAASITSGEEKIDRRFVGTWGNEKDARTMTICPSSAFCARDGNTMDFGRVSHQGNTLVFTADGGKDWRPEVKFDGDRLILDGMTWTKR
jgi:hypothetical protein